MASDPSSSYRYQDLWAPEKVVPGERGCAERWDLISPYLPESGVLCDVGSNLGYYTVRAASSHPALFALSLESDVTAVTQQQALLAAHGLHNVCLVESTVTGAAANQWAQTCDLLDLTLVLSVAHWFDDPATVLAGLSSISKEMLVELVDADDTGACGQQHVRLWADDPRTWLENVTGRDVELVARTTRHTSTAPGHLLRVHGDIQEHRAVPYTGGPTYPLQRDRYVTGWEGGQPIVKIGGTEVERIAGLNVVNLSNLGRLWWPHPKHLQKWYTEALQKEPSHKDAGPHNVLATANGVALIDNRDDGALQRPASAFRAAVRRWYRGNPIGEPSVWHRTPRGILHSAEQTKSAAWARWRRWRTARSNLKK